MTTGTNPSISNLRVVFPPYVVQKVTTHTDIKALNMSHKPQRCFWGIFVGITQHQKGYLIYVPSIRKILSSNNVLDKNIYSTLEYISRQSSEALATQTTVSYIPYATSSHKKL